MTCKMRRPPPGVTKQPRCTARTRAGTPCACAPLPGRDVCRWHSTNPADVERRLDASRRGGENRGAASPFSVLPICLSVDVAALDVHTAEGLRGFVASALRQCAELPFSVQTAHAIAALANTQRAVIEAADLEGRLAFLEASTRFRAA